MQKLTVFVCTCGRRFDDIVKGCSHCKTVDQNREPEKGSAAAPIFWILYFSLFAAGVFCAWKFGG